MLTALDVHRELLGREVPHEIVRLPGTSVARAADLPAALDVPAGCCVAVAVYLSDTGPLAVLLPVGEVAEPRAVLAAARARWVRTATPDEVNRLTDYTAGLVCPVGLPADVRLIADTALQGDVVLYCPVGEGGVVLGIRSADLLLAVGAVPAALTGTAPGAPS